MFVLYFCFLIYVLCVFVLFCILFLFLYWLFPISVGVSRPLPPGVSSIEVNKYNNNNNNNNHHHHHHHHYILSVLILRSKWTAVAQWLRCFAKNRKVAGSIPAGVIGEFFIDIKSFPSHYGPGVDSARNRSDYQEYFLGVKAEIGRASCRERV